MTINGRKALVAGTVFAAVSGLLYGAGAAGGAFDRFKQNPSAAAARDAAPELSDAALLERIRSEAPARRVPAQNARLDRVWKAIPGLNGLEVDVDKTFEAAKKSRSSGNIPWVYKQVEPQIQLKDLGAQPVYKGHPDKKMAAFMINVAWGEEWLPGMLDTLRKADVKATFFFDGKWLRQHADIARAIMAEGHELSNHAYSHRNMGDLSRAEQREEIRKTESLLQELGVKNRLFAPPSGHFNETTVRVAAEEFGLTTVLWTLDTVDWKNPPASSVVRKIQQRLEPGFLVLMHPTAASSGALPGMIEAARSKGIRLGTVSELLSSARTEPVPMGE
ncbi:polysaccharide deacetylase family protein [Paenibacillus thermoaerophilus]|uniref:Polysaccharide deacetylase family protein n=1 Tax=Paenibacillus thermoaerophilus TaxID=1215385 RepID=A0ABW2V3H4_9BACL|nr:polysaccharide deacetylase family protein [Paenibacillus thermoaerophilus]TMV13842.1 hypothetical protein FE781_11645 [Paenibacillus thermoaerophilus]